jgi:hypothetical protein
MIASKQKQLIIQLDCLLIEYEYYKSIANLNRYEKVVKKDELLKNIVIYHIVSPFFNLSRY